MSEQMPGVENSFDMSGNTLTLQRTLTDQLKVGSGPIHTEATQEEAEQLANEVEKYLRVVAENAPGCCIDGRNCTHNLDGSSAELRPSVAGGPLVTAYAAAELTGWFGENDEQSREEKLQTIRTVLEAGGIVLGAHVDETAVANNYKDPQTGAKKTGCGADDKAPQIVSAIYGQSEIIDGLTATLVSDFDQTAMKFVDSTKIGRAFADWDPIAVLNASKSGTGGNVEVLEKTHKEVLVVFNYVENTTVDRDALVEKTGKQVFVVDMWYIDKLARALAVGPDATKRYTQLRHAMVSYQVGTYLTLCDGSQRALLLTNAA